ncbi:MAG: flagellar basal body P-ring protein FlgI [Gemmataceae bacterium]
MSARHPQRPRSARWLAAGALAVALSGCGDLTGTFFHRAVSAEESADLSYDVPVVGDRTLVGNAEPVRLGGVGLVEGLEGTGGDCNHDSYRSMLVNDLRVRGERSADKLLRSPDCALVIVEATMTPGSGAGDLVEVEVKLPPGSRATSLRGGTLRKCKLFNYDFAKNLKTDYTGSQGMLLGHALATAEGPVLVSGDADDAVRAKAGRIWQGGKVTKEHPLALVMNRDSQRAALTGIIVDRVNNLFLPSFPAAGEDKPAVASTPNVVALRVPAIYRQNIPRYLRVVRFIPLVEGTEAGGGEGKDRKPYRHRLGEDVLDPAKAVVAALRLEALGPKSVPTLKAGLESKHPLVRFCSAEALAYLGHPSCAEELGRAARHPLFRAYALTALASLRESACQQQLVELIETAADDETRYGAFRALLTLNPRHPAVAGDNVGGSFFLHRLAPDSPPLVHLSTSRRAEVALFGKTPTMKPPFSLLAGEFTVTADADDQRCTVSRTPLSGGPDRRSCGLEVDAVIRQMADLGGQYSDVLALLQQAGAVDAVTCRVRLDALPTAVRIEELAASGADPSLLPGGQDLGQTPTLYGK